MEEQRQRSLLAGLKYQHLVAGLLGGVASTLATHPFDLIKLRFAVDDGRQLQGRTQYRGLCHATWVILREEGARKGLYRGASANVTGAGLSWGLYFFFYNALKFYSQGGNVDVQLSSLVHLTMASCAGIATMSLVNPVWVVKTRMCLISTEGVPPHRKYRNVLDGLVKLGRHEGLRGLYKGYIPGLVGTSHGAVQFMVYEKLRNVYCSYHNIPISTKLGPLEYIAMAALSKLVAASVTYPYQVVRARLQDQVQRYSGMWDVVARVWRHEGPRGFYKGLSANIAKVVPATCITFVIYEYTSQFLLQH